VEEGLNVVLLGVAGESAEAPEVVVETGVSEERIVLSAGMDEAEAT
jgi:hypothetical protein